MVIDFGQASVYICVGFFAGGGGVTRLRNIAGVSECR